MDRIIRVKQSNNFTIIPNSVFQCELSLKAIGLITYILHLPDDWKLYKTHLYKTMPADGRSSIQAAWEELTVAGYITSEQVKVKGKKLPEINYIVYDIPQKRVDFKHAQNQHTCEKIDNDVDFKHADFKHAQNQHLLNTNRTKKEPNQDSVNTIVLTEPGKSKAAKKPKEKLAQQEKAPPSPAPPPPENLNPGLYPQFIDKYFVWFQANNDGIPPKMDAAQGKAAKAIIGYLRTVVRAKAKTDKLLLTEMELDTRILDAWSMILDGWGGIEAYYQDKTRLIDINSNIQNIIKQIKNGITKQREYAKANAGRAGAKIGGAELADIFHTIDSRLGSQGPN